MSHHLDSPVARQDIRLDITDDQELLAEAGDSCRIGVWAVSTLATDAGGWRSINRVGLPMLPPLFTQYDEDLGDRLNAGSPSGDFKNYGEAVIKAVSGAVTANGTTEDAKGHAEKVARQIFPNMLPYTVGTPAVFGFAKLERTLPHGQRAQRDVLLRAEYPDQPGHRQGVGHFQTHEDVPIRSARNGQGSRIEPNQSGWSESDLLALRQQGPNGMRCKACFGETHPFGAPKPGCRHKQLRRGRGSGAC
jgi:hypothetical protein